VATILDQVVTHQGWAGPTFALGGYNEIFAPAATGLVGGSWWAGVLNGQPTDFAANFSDAAGATVPPVWFNANFTGQRSGPCTPANYPITSSTRIRIFTRGLQQNAAINVRLVVTDQPVTPPPVTAPCQYGTRPIAGQALVQILTPELIQAVLAARGWGWMALLFVPLQFVSFAVDQLCASPPLLLDPIDTDMIGRDLGVTLNAFKSVAWPYFCECVPGTPAPVPYPPPDPVQPPNWPTAPIFVCSDADICSTLEAIQRQVASLQQTVASQLALTTLIQRYDTPFAYQRGAVHVGLVGEGSFPIPRSVGAQIEVTSGAPPLVLPGNPDYWWNIGWMSILGPDGLLEERRIARQSTTWMPAQMQQATSFAWSLRPGVVINMRELYAEV
jgi:hypothetical protein